MKKWRILPLLLVLALLLSACSQSEPAGQINGYEVNTQDMTITGNGHTYHYVRYGVEDGSDMTIWHTTIYYPNGAEYKATQKFRNGSSGAIFALTEGDYDPDSYAPGEDLVVCINKALEQAQEKKTVQVSWEGLIIGVIAIALGVLGLIFPEETWYLSTMFRRWQYRDPDPTEEALFVTRIGAVVLILIGIVAIVKAIL